MQLYKQIFTKRISERKNKYLKLKEIEMKQKNLISKWNDKKSRYNSN